MTANWSCGTLEFTTIRVAWLVHAVSGACGGSSIQCAAMGNLHRAMVDHLTSEVPLPDLLDLRPESPVAPTLSLDQVSSSTIR